MPVRPPSKSSPPLSHPAPSQSKESSRKRQGKCHIGHIPHQKPTAETQISQRKISTPQQKSTKQWRRLALATRLGIRANAQRPRKVLVKKSQKHYCDELKNSLEKYKDKHTLRGYVSDSPDEEVNKAWSMYRAARDNSLGLLLLGKGDIRNDSDLTHNFGYTSVHGAEEGFPSQLIRQATRERVRDKHESGTDQVPALGSGSILCDKGWSPMLNDAFILGGVHGENQFGLAMPQLENAEYSSAADMVKHHTDLFWPEDSPFPSILTREILGLRSFGYGPEWTKAGLSFSCKDHHVATVSSHDIYLEALQPIMEDRELAIKTLKEYLNIPQSEAV